MKLINEAEQLELHADRYRLIFAQDKPFVHLEDENGNRLAELFVLSSIHPLEGRDDTTKQGDWKVCRCDQEVVFTLRAESSVWKAKTYRFRCGPNRFSYEMEVEGAGRLAEVNYFGGYCSANPRWGSGFFWSGTNFRQGFNPEPNMAEENYFSPNSGSVIDLTGVPLPGKGDWFFTPPPFCFAFEKEKGWVSMGVEAEPGSNTYTEYIYHAQQFGFCLSLSFEGYTPVRGSYRLPAIGFDFADSEYEALKAHVESLAKAGYVTFNPNKEKPAWWYEPIFCGWGSQCYAASLEQGHAPDYARQELYEQFMKTLDQKGVTPGIVVLDDKWQAAYGENKADTEKWPDLRGFIDKQHQAGKKVLLWLKAWDAEGVPAEECMTNASGLAMIVDPTNPAFEKRLRQSVRHMLSADGYDADGFKIDFSARISCGPGVKKAGEAWGLELMRLYLGIIYDEAKKVKPDALVMTHTPHPYLNDVVDMIRLNDINTGKDVVKAMTHRAKVASIACPDAVIDTDNWPMTDRASWRDYVAVQPQLGVPSLYYVSHIDSTKEELTEDDYDLIRQAWEQARRQKRTGRRAEG